MGLFGKKKQYNDQVNMASYTSNEYTSSKHVEHMVPYIATMIRTSTGNRKYQQDAVYVTPGKVLAANKKIRTLAIVCDGMGGMADGGRASLTAIEMMKQGFKNIEKLDQVNIPYFFQKGIIAIDKTISMFPKENGRGSGTTMVACIVEDNKMFWASVGDSRIYIVRNNIMKQVTRDHNYALKLQELVDAGKITEEEKNSNRQKEALISYLGKGDVSLMDISPTPFEMQFGDVIMLCSDGITKTLPDAQIKRIITAEEVPPERKAEALVEAAIHINSHSQDNTSVAIIEYKEINVKEISSQRG